MSLFNFVKANIPINELISEYVDLKLAGNYWKGPCPFHYEKEASFTVSPDKEIFYCFGCHAKGDVISFISKKENITPLESAKFLVDKYQLEVPEEIKQGVFQKLNDNSLLKNNFFNVCKIFSEWTNAKLLQNSKALSYLKKRKISDELIKYFNIGYFPGGNRNINELLRFIGKKDYIAKDLIDAKILMQGKNTLYSPFEERIIFPIKDSMSRFCGFGGRIFHKQDTRAKYYNSKESIWFSKGKLLFGLDLAKPKIQEEKKVFLVEGYTDCISMVEHGYKNSVAILGTSCTAEHLKILSRYADYVFVLYDGDQAGQNAILRLTQLCWNVNLELKIIKLPAKEDPATFLEKNENLNQLIKNSEDIFIFFVKQMSNNFSSKSLSEKVSISKSILQLIGNINDELKREILIQQASKSLELPVSSFRNVIFYDLVAAKSENKEYYVRGKEEEEKIQDNIIPILEERIFSVIINNMDKPDKLYVPEDLIEYFSKYIQYLFKKLMAFIKNNENSTQLFNEFLSNLNEKDKNWVIQCSFKFNNQKENKESLQELLALFCKKYWKQIIRDIKQKMTIAEEQQDKKRLKELFNLFTQLKINIQTRGLI